MAFIRQVLRDKGQVVFVIGPEDSVFRAVTVMAEKDIGALVVMDRDAVAGIVTERHYARKVALQGRSSKQLLVHEIMETRVPFVGPERSVEECMAIMTSEHTRYLPVIHDGRLVGIVSIGDLVKAIISEQKFIIEELTEYIVGDR